MKHIQQGVVMAAAGLLHPMALALAAADPPIDPVPHAIITQPYRVCQGLEEVTARIDNLYRKPYAKLYHNGIVQPETIFFKDTVSGHEVMSLTRELCSDISHPDLERPVWTVDGRQILFMGNRGFYDLAGKLRKDEWPGYKFVMNADYSSQRPLFITYLDAEGKTTGKGEVIDGKFNIFDRKDPQYAYYAVNDTLWRVRIGKGVDDNLAEPLCKFSTNHLKIIQDISEDDLLLIQDINPDPEKTTGLPVYMPEIHLVNLNKRPGAEGFYFHHPADYGLPEIKDATGKVVHDARNSYHFHSLQFTGKEQIGWNYGPMTDVGEYLGWTLDIKNGLGGIPTHTDVQEGAAVNRWGQYESHGNRIGTGQYALYFSGPVQVPGKGQIGGWGLWLQDESHPETPPRFVLVAPGGHVAGGKGQDPDTWAAFISAGWRDKVKESDSIVWGDTSGKWEVLCYTYSDVRGGIHKDPKTGLVEWSGPDNNDFRPYSSLPRPLLSPDGTKLWFHSSMLQPLEEWTGVFVAVTHRPYPPQNLKLSADGSAVQVEWQPAPVAHEVKGYHVYRGDADGRNVVELTERAIGGGQRPALTFTDTTATVGHTYTYAVTAEEWSTLESDTTSNVLKVTVSANGTTAVDATAWKGWDRTAPAAVHGFQAVREPDAEGQYRLSWLPAPEKDLRYYNVYFSTRGRPEVDQKRLIVSPLAGERGYLDWSAPVGTAVHYAITAVDRQGNEGPPAYAEVVGPGG